MVDTRHKDYWEAVLQLRECNPEFCEKILNEIEESGRATIAKVEALKNGIDIYVSDGKWLLAYGKRLRERFGGELATSRKLHTRNANTGKEVFRVTVLFRKLPFTPGDIITTEDGDLRLVSVSKMAHVQYVKSGKKILMRLDDLSRLANSLK